MKYVHLLVFISLMLSMYQLFFFIRIRIRQEKQQNFKIISASNQIVNDDQLIPNFSTECPDMGFTGVLQKQNGDVNDDNPKNWKITENLINEIIIKYGVESFCEDNVFSPKCIMKCYDIFLFFAMTQVFFFMVMIDSALNHYMNLYNTAANVHVV